MLNNFWYAVALSSKISHQPHSVMLGGHRIVLFRNSQTEVIALQDHCAHRGAALSTGWLEGDCLRCPYHGWKYQSNGECVEIPANAPEMTTAVCTTVCHNSKRRQPGCHETLLPRPTRKNCQYL